MFCVKCGNQIEENQAFCPKCGNPVVVTPADNNYSNISNNAPANNYAGAPYQSNSIYNSNIPGQQNYNLSFQSVLSNFRTAKIRNLLFGLAGLLILSAILIFMPTFKISVLIGSETINMFNDIEIIGVITCLAYVASAVLLFVPIIAKKPWSRIFLLPSKIVAFWTAGWFLLVLALAYDAAGEYEGLASVSLAIPGWFLIVSIVATIVISFMLSTELKRNMSL